MSQAVPGQNFGGGVNAAPTPAAGVASAHVSNGAMPEALAARSKTLLAAATAEVNREAAGTREPEATPEPAAETPAPAGKKGKAGKERGADGKFLSEKAAKVAPVVPLEEAPAEPAADPPAEEAPKSGKETYSLKHARELLSAGKPIEAMNALLRPLGKTVDEINIPSKSFAALRQERHELQQRETRLQQERAQAQDYFRPYLAVAKAMEEDDIEGAIAALGTIKLKDGRSKGWKGVGDLSKEGLRQFANADPEAKRLRAELEDFKRQQRERDERAEAERKQAVVKADEVAYVEQLKGELAEVDNENLAWAAGRPAFARKVFEILREGVQARRIVGMPSESDKLEAAEQAFAEIYGEDFDVGEIAVRDGARRGNREVADPGSAPQVKPQPAAKRGASSLRSDRAAEASAPVDLKGTPAERAAGKSRNISYFADQFRKDMLAERAGR